MQRQLLASSGRCSACRCGLWLGTGGASGTGSTCTGWQRQTLHLQQLGRHCAAVMAPAGGALLGGHEIGEYGGLGCDEVGAAHV